MAKLRRTLLMGVMLAAIAASPAGAVPIPSSSFSSLPEATGGPATAQPVKPTIAPRNRYLARGAKSNIHNDTWMTDAYRRRGPLGQSLVSASDSKPLAVCGTLAFDRAGRILSVCPSMSTPPQARIMDPQTLETLGAYDMPNAPRPADTPLYQDFAGGGYFFLDNHDRMWVPTKNDRIQVLAVNDAGDGFELRRDYDLTSVLDTESERITSALPDFQGRIWFVSKQNGKVGVLDRKTREVHVKRLGENIENSFAVGADGVYIVSDTRLYRFKANQAGAPRVIWKKRYPDSGIVKPGQVDAGSGTTPTLMTSGYVAITDNADPMDVVVYRTARRLRGEKREVCRVPVFSQGASASENSLITAGRALVVENNYGYVDPFDPTNIGALTEPGFARVDVRRDGSGCRLRWTNTEVRGSSVVPKLSTKTGLIYTYSRPEDPAGGEGWFWTAIDFRSGETRWTHRSGSGFVYNNNYAGLALGRDGTAYLGVVGGLISLRDGG